MTRKKEQKLHYKIDKLIFSIEDIFYVFYSFKKTVHWENLKISVLFSCMSYHERTDPYSNLVGGGSEPSSWLLAADYI